jgi:hypothetical protein
MSGCHERPVSTPCNTVGGFVELGIESMDNLASFGTPDDGIDETRKGEECIPRMPTPV